MIALTAPIVAATLPVMIGPVYDVFAAERLPSVAAEVLATVTQQAVERRGVAHIALSGGSTPRSLFRLLARPEWQAQVPWARVHVWWADERCVPPDHPDSNYAVAYTLLLGHLSVVHVHRMRGEVEDPAVAAAAYEAELRQVFRLGPTSRPRFDLILLGMGADGHTASLFPGTAAIEESHGLVAVGEAPVVPLRRITLTLPVLNRSAYCLFLVAGADKGPALTRVFWPDPQESLLPAGRVDLSNGRIFWLLDTAAAEAASLP